MGLLEMLAHAVLEFSFIFGGFFYTTNIKPTLKIIALYMLISVVPTIVLVFWFPQWIIISYFLVSTVVIFCSVTKTILSAMNFCVVVVGGIVADHFSMLLKNYLIDSVGETSIVIELVLFCFIYAVLIHIYKVTIQKENKSLEFPWFVQYSLLIIMIVTLFVVYLTMFLQTSNDEFQLVKINLLVQLSYFVSMIILFTLLLNYFKKRNSIRQKEIEFEQFLYYMKELEQVNQDMHKFRHDYVNILLTMRGFLDDNNMTGLKSYFHDHIIKVEQQTLHHNLMFIQLKNIKISELKGLIATKLIAAEKSKVLVNVEVPDEITEINMDIIDLARIIGILLDNAIEGSEDIQLAKINVAILLTIDGDVVIVIENRTNLTDINISRLFDENVSTKGSQRGLGLSTVRSIISNYPNTVINTSIDNEWFIQEVVVETRRVS